jgi:hypothetical protein
MSELRILFVDDEPADVALACIELERGGLEFCSRRASSERELKRELASFEPDIVLATTTSPAFQARAPWRWCATCGPPRPFS